MDEQKRKFLDDAFFRLTVMATLPRSKTYREGATDADRARFKEALRERLIGLAQQYTSPLCHNM
jgi:hypothetical protein